MLILNVLNVFSLVECSIYNVFSNGRYIDYLSLTYTTNKNKILKVPL